MNSNLRLIPVALQDFLLALGCTARSVTFIVTACLMTQLNLCPHSHSENVRGRVLLTTRPCFNQQGIHKIRLHPISACCVSPKLQCSSKYTLTQDLSQKFYFRHYNMTILPDSLRCGQDTVWRLLSDTKTINCKDTHLCFSCVIWLIPDLADYHAFKQPAASNTLPGNAPY